MCCKEIDRTEQRSQWWRKEVRRSACVCVLHTEETLEWGGSVCACVTRDNRTQEKGGRRSVCVCVTKRQTEQNELFNGGGKEGRMGRVCVCARVLQGDNGKMTERKKRHRTEEMTRTEETTQVCVCARVCVTRKHTQPNERFNGGACVCVRLCVYACVCMLELDNTITEQKKRHNRTEGTTRACMCVLEEDRHKKYQAAVGFDPMTLRWVCVC